MFIHIFCCYVIGDHVQMTMFLYLVDTLKGTGKGQPELKLLDRPDIQTRAQICIDGSCSGSDSPPEQRRRQRPAESWLVGTWAVLVSHVGGWHDCEQRNLGEQAPNVVNTSEDT